MTAAIVVLMLSASGLAAASSALGADWLIRVNELRAVGALPPVTENSVWSQGCWYHSRYMVENNFIGHFEDVGKPWYTSEGDAATRSSNLFLGVGGVQAIDGWMQTPFHGVGIIDPSLQTVGFGTYSSTSSAAALDVLRGLGPVPSSVTYPVYWPASGRTIPFESYWGAEYPDPLSNSGYTPPTGAPIFLLLGSGSVTPIVSGTSLRAGAQELPHLVLTETNYSNSDLSAQSLGRAVLDSRDAVVLIPQTPLVQGQRYDVQVICNGATYSWWFNAPPDTVSPVTSAVVYSRYVESATVQLSAEDNLYGSGVAHTYYRVDGGVATEGNTVLVGGIGTHSLEFWSVDLAGNEEAHSVRPLAIVPPVSGTPKPSPYVGSPLAPRAVSRGAQFTTFGYLRPRHPAGTRPVRVYRYRLISGAWRSYGYTSASAGNYSTYTRYSARVRLPYAGRWRLRSYAPADARHSSAWSRGYDYITVR